MNTPSQILLLLGTLDHHESLGIGMVSNYITITYFLLFVYLQSFYRLIIDGRSVIIVLSDSDFESSFDGDICCYFKTRVAQSTLQLETHLMSSVAIVFNVL